MDSPATFLTIAVIALTIASGLVKTVEKLIEYFVSRRSNGKSDLVSLEQKQKLLETHAITMKTYEIVSRVDKDGAYLCYFPRTQSEIYKTMVELQYRTIEMLGQVTTEQHRVADILDKLERRLNS